MVKTKKAIQQKFLSKKEFIPRFSLFPLFKNLTKFTMVIFCLIVAIILSPEFCHADYETGWGLVEDFPLTSPGLCTIWGSSENDIYIVERNRDSVPRNTKIFHYDGNAWSQIDSGTALDITGVWGTAADDVYFVGGTRTNRENIILHYNGSSWTPMDSGTTKNLHAVWGADGIVYAGGREATILKYEDGSWTQMDSGDASPILNIITMWGTAWNNVYAVGWQIYGDHESEILHYDGTSWSKMPLPSGGPYRYMTGLWGAAGDDIYAVGGTAEDVQHAVILHYDGTSWSEVFRDSAVNRPHQIWGSSATDVYAVGYNGGILHYDGASWSQMNRGISAHLHGVWGSSESDVYAAGGNHVLHYPAEVHPIEGQWSSTNIYGSGTWNPATCETTSGSIHITVQTTGDITATFDYTAVMDFSSGTWEGTTAEIEGTVEINGVEHPAGLWLKGNFNELVYDGYVLINPGPPEVWWPTSWSTNYFSPMGTTHGWTTDGSKLTVDFGWSGTGTGPLQLNPDGTWVIPSGGTAGGNWNGFLSEALEGKTEFAESGTGVVELSGTSSTAALHYDADVSGSFLLAQYKGNVGEDFPAAKQALGKFIQVSTNIIDSQINWSSGEGVELRLYYTEDELTAAGLDESALKMYRWNGTDWGQAADTGVNAEENYI